MTVDMSLDIPMESLERLALLTPECCNVIKKRIEDYKRKARLCKS